jgi:GLPGLI family protein
MKKSAGLFGCFFFIMAGIAFSQETVLLNVLYEFKYMRDLAQKDNPYISNMVLSLGKNTSRWCTEESFKDNNKNIIREKRKQQENEQQMSSMPRTTVTGGPTLRITKAGVAIREEIIKDIPKQKLQTIGRIASKTYFVDTDLPKINWVLQNEKKTIDKYTCQKAVGTYAGRAYEVWFTTDLPFRDGPWKLHGLPGLILEAHDSTNQVVITYKEISRNDDGEETVTSFLKDPFSIETKLKAYNRARAAFDADPQAIILAQHPDAKIHVKSMDGSSNKQVVKIKKYNPIELD